MFDRSFLPEAALEFVVLADTHYMLDSGSSQLEFASRRLQTARAEHVLQLVAALRPAFVVHLGDLVQEFPGSPAFDQAMDEATAQLRRCGVWPRFVAGNHDVGDKPDPLMPTDWVSAESLAAYHERFGDSWYSWDVGEVHCVVVNSQIMNSLLPQAQAQERWLEADLASCRGRRIFLFLHLPPYLSDQHEPGLGHYDNIAEPARSWLLQLIRQHRVELLFAAHTHFAFCDRIGTTRYYVVPPTTFTRPGFGEVLADKAPPERGRNDAAKLGFYLVRVHREETRVHLVRSYGSTAPLDPAEPRLRLLTCTTRDLPQSPLGITGSHPLSHRVHTPVAWPSAVRQQVRNDYPLLACTELGAQHIRVPGSDLEDEFQRERLAILRDEGVRVTATYLWSKTEGLAGNMASHREHIDGIEVQIVRPFAHNHSDEMGELYIGALELTCLDEIASTVGKTGLSLTLAPIVVRERVAGKQHSRARLGYRWAEVETLNERLCQKGRSVARVLCRIGPDASPWESLTHSLPQVPFTHIGAVDFVLELATFDEREQIKRAAEAVCAISLWRGSRLFLEPLLDLDRNMDAGNGLLDRLCNPRPVFHVVRHLNTILFARPEARVAHACATLDSVRALGVGGETTELWLLLPLRATGQEPIALHQINRLQLDSFYRPSAARSEKGLGGSMLRCFGLESGYSHAFESSAEGKQTIPVDEASLLMIGATTTQPPVTD